MADLGSYQIYLNKTVVKVFGVEDIKFSDKTLKSPEFIELLNLEPNRLHIRIQYDWEVQHCHSFSSKVTSGQITEEKATPLVLFYRKILCHRAYSLIEIDGIRITLNFTQIWRHE
jgi:hypothetical protein